MARRFGVQAMTRRALAGAAAGRHLAGAAQAPFTVREVSAVSLTIPRGKATVGQLCGVFGTSRQPYYAARKGGRSSEAEALPRCHPGRRGPWVSDAALVEKIQQVVVGGPRLVGTRAGARRGEETDSLDRGKHAVEEVLQPDS